MRVLITGGAGFLGINLTRFLLSRGYDVTCLDIAEFEYPEREDVTLVRGDIRNSKDVGRAYSAAGGADAVVHAAAALPLYRPEDIHSTDAEGTRLVFETAHQRHIDRVVHISSTAVYGIPEHHPLREDDPLDGVGPYGRAKIAAEQIGLEYRSIGMCVPILRPKSFVGPERLGVFALFYDWASTGHNFPLLGNGQNRYQLLDVDDLCDAIHLTLTLPAHHASDTFNIGATEFSTMAEDYQAVLDEAGFGKRVIPLPAAPAIAVLRVLQRFNLSPLYEWVYETAWRNSFVSIERSQAKLSFQPRYSNRDALLRNYRWYLDNLAFFDKASGVSHRVPWKQGVLALGKMIF